MTSRSVVLDSSVWIEILNNGPRVKACMKELKSADQIIVPTVVLYEVYKKTASARSDDHALSAIAVLSQYEVVDLSREVALAAADLSLQKSMAMADSVVLAHSQQAGAILITLDNDFSGIAGTQVLR